MHWLSLDISFLVDTCLILIIILLLSFKSLAYIRRSDISSKDSHWRTTTVNNRIWIKIQRSQISDWYVSKLMIIIFIIIINKWYYNYTSLTIPVLYLLYNCSDYEVRLKELHFEELLRRQQTESDTRHQQELSRYEELQKVGFPIVGSSYLLSI